MDPFASTPSGGFDQKRKANVLRGLAGAVFGHSTGARKDRNTGSGQPLPRAGFIAAFRQHR